MFDVAKVGKKKNTAKDYLFFLHIEVKKCKETPKEVLARRS